MNEVELVVRKSPFIGAVFNLAINSAVKIMPPFATAQIRWVTAYNLTFGGTQVGWMGEISVPVTWQSGNVSATSLAIDESLLAVVRNAVLRGVNLHCPYA